METNSELALWLIIWISAALAVLVGRLKSNYPGTGLVLAYIFSLWLIHWGAVCLYLIPGYDFYDLSLVKTGFEQSTYGILAFACGSLVVTPSLLRFRRSHDEAILYEVNEKLPRAYMYVGAVAYMLLSSSLGRLPTANALVSVGQQLFIIGLCLTFWMAWWKEDLRLFFICCGITLLLPFVTIVTRGFIGYGTIAVLTVATFIVSYGRLSAKVIIAALLLGYVGLSFYVSYMRDRTEIREVVWAGEPLGKRVSRVYQTLNTLEWFDISEENHLSRIDERLNQNILVGHAVDRLGLTEDYARGETLWESVTALIPRALWPDKPISAGSGDLVTRYTGIRFAEGTSVGIGQVMEFYINFGTAGVIIGFLMMGIIVTFIDITAGQRLWNDDWQSFALWYLTGISFLQVGGSLGEVTSSAGASVVAALLVNKALLYRFQRKQVVESGETEEVSAY